MSNIIQRLWKAHDQKILIIMAIFLSSLVSFQFGKSQAELMSDSPITINIHASMPANPKSEKIEVISKALDRAGATSTPPVSNNQGAVNKPQNTSSCVAVASKSSNKYHLPTCRYASKIKKENLLCFSSEEEAKQQGFQMAKCCHK